MKNGTQAALENRMPDLNIGGDSRLAIQQSMEVIACKNDSFQVMLTRRNDLVA